MAYDSRMSIIQGDALQVFRPINNLPTGSTIVKAWLTMKLNIADIDGDAIIQKVITTSNVIGLGQIEADGTGGTKARLRFDIEYIDSQDFVPGIDYWYDIQVKTSGSSGMNVFTVETGMWSIDQQITITNT